MGSQLQNMFDRLSGVEPIWFVLWFGLLALTIILLLLTRTRWGQSRSLEKCIFLSLLAHALLAGYAATVNIVTAVVALEEQSIELAAFEPDAEAKLDPTTSPEPKAWNKFIGQSIDVPIKKTIASPVSLKQKSPNHSRNPVRVNNSSAPLPLPPTEKFAHQQMTSESHLPSRVKKSLVKEEKIEPHKQQVVQKKTNDTKLPEAKIAKTDLRNSEIQRTPQASSTLNQLRPNISIAKNMAKVPLPVLKSLSNLRRESNPRVTKDSNSSSGSDSLTTPNPRDTPSKITAGSPPIAKLPDVYQMRVAPDREKVAKKLGATKETEAAVKLALKWFSANQSKDGRWDTDQLEGGKDLQVLGHNRQGAGVDADTGITGLVLLAYLGAGHTHLKGEYKDEVRRGLNFLLRSQAANGNLFGKAHTFAKMYCHGMSSFALSEAYAMTGDKRLKPAVLAAINYTISAQHPSGGGWRYQRGDRGDTSQLGWQVMAIKSAELAGIKIPLQTKLGIRRFLKNVSSGRNGGLASYRPGQRASQTMTAEALSCRLFLGLEHDHPAVDEALQLINQHPPGEGKPNLYYWYYATLACHQVQGEAWKKWNRKLIKTLTSSQQTSGSRAGSWDPKTVWGGYGGRAYSTAMATLSLEVYYRFLPLYGKASGRNNRLK